MADPDAAAPPPSPSLGSWIVRGAGFAAGVALVGGIIALAAAAGNVLVLVLLSVILASGLEPVVGWVRGRVGIGRGATILLVDGLFFLAVVGLFVFVAPAAIAQFDTTLRSLPPLIERTREWAAELRPVAVSRGITTLLDAADRTVAPPVPTSPTSGQVVQVGLTLVEAIVSMATLLVVVYLWLVEHARLQRYVLAFVPMHHRATARDRWNEVETRLGLWVRGQLTLMAAMGAATTVAYVLLGVPGALLLGLIAAVAEAIPIIGPLLGAIPAILTAATVSTELALVVAGVYVVIQLLEGNVLVPIVMRRAIGISPFLVILSLLIGGAVGGLIGALLAVPIAAAIEVLIEGLQKRDVPVAQDPTTAEEPGDRSLTDAADAHAGAD
jgi:predicted PurR-regulated permease PerM